ncbi:conserved hypothetical protein [Talaromyces stipitatus ATCC 10500]|uniref:Uncharacterized protein n=1 Tax=Talaromyces stipitatus (strain ATCC 10500 / CBS 375.48 / QM 6759 / NRRL 1006) TaxID=441959 RepID=B8M0L8_TALSN|nr:uncharacterized protein TSTA_086320 [Talaromyces stipitatus ATCC 10500]EED21401.1 conserved hypothetical protein [Talaromyces stipitatus ATCC 10500]
MKTQAQPATVQDLDQNDNLVLHGIKSASRIAKSRSSSSPPQKINLSYVHKQIPMDKVIYGKSISRPIEQMARIFQSYNRGVPLTIFSRSRDRSRERNEVPGCKFRKVFVSDDTEVLESNPAFRSKYVGLTAFISEKDKNHIDPRIYVEQSFIDPGTGKENLIVHELALGSNVDTDYDYVFKDCVDEHPVFGKRSLRVRIKALNEMTFESYMKAAGYYGYDRTEYAVVNKYILDNGLPLSINIPNCMNQQFQTVSFDAADLRLLLEAKEKIKDKKQVSSIDGGLELLTLRVHGLGEISECQQYLGALDIRVVYTPL